MKYIAVIGQISELRAIVGADGKGLPSSLHAAFAVMLGAWRSVTPTNAAAAGKESGNAESDPTEFCWLVEHFLGDGSGNSTGKYHTGFTDFQGDSRSTSDPLRAKRYQTAKEAAAVAAKLGATLSGTWRAVEHGFITRAAAEIGKAAGKKGGE